MRIPEIHKTLSFKIIQREHFSTDNTDRLNSYIEILNNTSDREQIKTTLDYLLCFDEIKQNPSLIEFMMQHKDIIMEIRKENEKNEY